MKLVVDDQAQAPTIGDKVSIPFPDGAKQAERGAKIHGKNQQWRSPRTIDKLLKIYKKHDFEDIYLIHANTAYGVYTEDFLTSKYLVDISDIPELYALENDDDVLRVGAGTTYTDFLNYLDQLMTQNKLSQTSAVGALQFMAHRTAGTVVRNSATLAGNSMLVLKHIHKGTGEPFPSDLFTVLTALNATILYWDLRTGEEKCATVEELLAMVIDDQALANYILLQEYQIPVAPNNDIVLAQKVALRDINAHSIVNTTSIFDLGEGLGACPRMEARLRKIRIWPFSAIFPVK
jgi:xanthine dehydrogenase/oxidase